LTGIIIIAYLPFGVDVTLAFVPASLSCITAQTTEFRAPMTRVILLISIALGFINLTKAQHELKFYQTLSASGIESLETQVDFKVNIIYWGADHIMVETSVSAPHSQAAIVQYLASEGRYKMELQEKEGKVAVSAPRVSSRPITTKNGSTIQESITLTVYLPEAFTQTSTNTFTRQLQDSVVASSF
jgi:hypothetical protein